MSAPERIHIIWNAADGYERFAECGISTTLHDTITPEQITKVLARQKGRLFRLLGWFGEPRTDVNLNVADYADAGLQMINHTEPPFEGTFVVAAEPPPHVGVPHGDYIFDLELVEQGL